MTSELHRRIARLKMTALLSMRAQAGPCHLADWWEKFTKSIPEGAAFADLDQETQKLIRNWEKKLAETDTNDAA